MSTQSQFSENPEDYKFRGIACKSDPDGNRYWTWLGAVVVPLEVDTQKEASDVDDVMWQAWEWCAKADRSKVDTNHNYKESEVVPVESFRAREGDPDFKVGSWVVRGLTFNPEIGEKVDSGELNAWSWAGPVDRELSLARISHPLEASGTTEKADSGPYPEHEHSVDALRFDDNAKIIPIKTGITFDHFHTIIGPTRTEKKDGHAHSLLIQAEG